MKRAKFALIALFIILLAGVASAQDNTVPPVRWRTIVRTTGPDTGTITFKALVAPGWHLYGLELPEGGPKPTHFDLAGSTGIEFTGTVTPVRKPLEVADPLFGMTLTWWDTNIDFAVPFRVTDAATARLSAKISYMACDGTTCMPPKTEDIATPIKLKKQ